MAPKPLAAPAPSLTRATLTIGGNTLTVLIEATALAAVTPDEVQVMGSAGDTYRLSRRAAGGWACTCRGFHFRGHCKHQAEADTAAIRATLPVLAVL